MRTSLTVLLLLWLGVPGLRSQDLGVKYKVEDLNGKIPLSLAHLWGQTLKMGTNTTPVELVEFEMVNQTERARSVQVGLQLVGLGEEATRTIALSANEKRRFEMSPIVDPKLANSVEDERVGKLRVEVKEGGNVIYADVKNISLAGKDDLPTVVSNKPLFFFFVTRVQPKSHLVDQVLAESAKRMGLQWKQGLVGYQGKNDPKQMHEDVRKIYKTIQAMGFNYVNTPVSFAQGFQRIKSPTEALRSRTGNCIDGTLVFASCLSAIGYNPLIAVVPGHAFVVATIPPEDMTRSRPTRMALYGLSNRSGAGNEPSLVYPSMLPIETTVLQGQSQETVVTRTTFEEAVKIGRANLKKYEDEKKLVLIDVEAWRNAGLIPVPESQ